MDVGRPSRTFIPKIKATGKPCANCAGHHHPSFVFYHCLAILLVQHCQSGILLKDDHHHCDAWLQGLAALLVQGLSGVPPEDIVRVQPDFIERLGLNHSLTPSRNNGFLNIFKLMQAKSLQLMAQQAA